MIQAWLTAAVIHVMADVAATPPNLWEWFAATTSVDQLIQAAGIGTLVVLFSTNRIITLGQHNSRIADLVKYHESELKARDASHAALLAEKDRAYAALETSSTRALVEMQGSRDYYRAARLDEQDRADKATDTLAEVTQETGRRFSQIMAAFGPNETTEGG